MKQLIIAILFFLPISVSAQLLNSYGVVEIGASFPLSSTRGAKFAYRVTDSSYYRWIHTNTWVKILEPSIEPDTLYLKQLSGTTALVDGDTIDISTYFLKSDTTSAFASYLKRPVGWGLSLLTGKYPFVDSSKVASRYYVSTSPTTIANNYIATSNGSNLVARNLFDNNTYVGILNSKPFSLGQWTTAGRPTGTANYFGWRDGTTFEWYNGTRWAAALESTFARGTAGRIPFFDANGQITDNSGLAWDNTNKYLAINKSSPTYHLEIQSFGTINQRWIGLYNSAGFQQASFDSDGSGNGAVYVYNNVGVIQGRFASGDVSFLTGKMAFGTQTIGLSDFLVLKRQSDFGINALLAVGQSGSGYPGLGYNVLFTSSASSFTRRYNYDPSYYIDLGTAGRFSIKTAPTGATGSSITFTENFSIVQSTGNVGIAQPSPQRRLDVNGEVRIADLITDTPTRFVGADADGDLGAISFSSTWRDYQTDKAILGSDSSFIHDPVQDTTKIGGTIQFGKPAAYPQSSSYPFTFRNPNNATTTILIESGRTSPTGGSAGVQFLASGQFGGSIDFGTATSSDLTFYSYFAGKNLFNIGLSNFVTGNKNTILVGQIQDPIQWDFNGRLVIYDTITSGKALFLAKKVASSSTPIAMFSSSSNDRFTFNDDGTTRFHVYGTPATTAAALSKTLTNYGVGFATDGTVTSRLVTTYGLYAGSGTLANHTTRALIPSTGNLLFSQTYNTTDSAYIQVINNLDGNREIRGGLTDTASTGFSKFRFYQDEPNEEMGWEMLTDDGTGTTTVGAQGGNLSLYADAAGTVEVRGQEIRLNNGEVSMNQYGQGNMKASDVSATDSKFVAKFGDAGKVLDYYLARDTFIEDVTLFSVGTLMNDCQELTIVSSMTATAPSHQEIRFPDAGDHLRGKKIIVYQKKKEAGIYVPQIKVVGGVSRLYFTTNTLTTDPSDQSVLSMDDVTWYTHGVTYEFTCLRIDNTPSYRWVLKQR